MSKPGLGKVVKNLVHTTRLKIPPSVSIRTLGEKITIEGPLGAINTDLSKLDTRGSSSFGLLNDTRELQIRSCDKAFFGTIQTLLKNKIKGVTQGYVKYLKIHGIGYRASVKDQTISLKLGYSHEVSYTLPPSLRALSLDQTSIGIFGIEKSLVAQAASNIRALRPPSAYKDRGIRYADEIVKLKAGKKK